MIRYNKLLISAGVAALSAGLYTSVASAASVNTASASARVITCLLYTSDAADDLA